MRVVSPLAIDAIKSEIQEFITESELMKDPDYELLSNLAQHVVFKTPPIRNMQKHITRVLSVHPIRDRFTDPVGARYLHFSPVGQTKVLQFCSEFESGNLKYAGITDKGEYLLLLRSDVYEKRVEKNDGRFHFYFQVRNNGIKKKIDFKIINLTRRLGLYDKGMKIWTYSEHRTVGRKLWRHGCSDIHLEGMNLCFSYEFKTTHDCTSFAMNIPYTYSMVLKFLADIKSNPFVQQSLEVKTICGLETKKLIITNFEIDEKKKREVLVTARTNASESASSWMAHGFITFLLSNKDPIAALLRNHFVFTVIPMMNPDGVVLGNTKFPHVTAEIDGIKKIQFNLHSHHRRRGFFCHSREISNLIGQLVANNSIGVNPLWFSSQYCRPNKEEKIVTVYASNFGAIENAADRDAKCVTDRLLFVPGVLKTIGAALAKMIGYKFGLIKMDTQKDYIPNEYYEEGSSEGSDEEIQCLVPRKITNPPHASHVVHALVPVTSMSKKISAKKSYFVRSSQLVPDSPVGLLRCASSSSSIIMSAFTPSACGVPSNALMIQPIHLSHRRHANLSA